MKKRLMSMLLIVAMLVNIIPLSAFAVENKGDGSKENPYQIGDTVISSEEPEGYKVENSIWEKEDIAAQYGENLICGENHVHSMEAGCFELTCTTAHEHSKDAGCTYVLNCSDAHHTDDCKGIICTETHHTDSCYTVGCSDAHHSIEKGCYTQKCSNTHTHSMEAGCYEVVKEAYTVWTLKVKEAAEPEVKEGAEPEVKEAIEPDVKEGAVAADAALMTAAEGTEEIATEEEEPPTYSVTINASISGSSIIPSGATIVVNGPLEEGGGAEGSNTYNATADAEGKATIEGLQEGKYVAVVTHSVTSGRRTTDYYGSQVFFITTANASVNVVMSSSSINWEDATSVYDRTTYFNHVDIRVSGSYTESEDSVLSNYNIKLQNATVTVTNNGSYGNISVAHNDNSETYEWRKTGIKVDKGAVITLICDIYDTSGNLLKEDFTVVFSGEVAFKQAIINCDNNQGLDFIINPITIVQAITYQVDYEWEVVGNDTAEVAALNAALDKVVSPPAKTEGYKSGAEHTVDTDWKVNLEKIVSVTDASGKTSYYLLTFHGWESYSNETTSAAPTSNGAKIEITSDTTVYGKWTYEELVRAEGNLKLVKTIQIEKGYESNLALENMWFDVTIGNETIGVTFSQMTEVSRTESADGKYTIIKLEYTLPVKEEGSIVIEENGVDLRGFTRASSNAVASEKYTAEINNIQTTINMIEVNQAATTNEKVTANVALPHIQTLSLNAGTFLGTVSFTNTYSAEKGEPVYIYPDLIIRKMNKDTYELLKDVEFTLTGVTGEAAGFVQVKKTDAYGIIDFKDLKPGTYNLQETKALDGYAENDTVYKVTVTGDEGHETLVDGKWVTTYEYSVTVEGLAIHYNYYTVYNQKTEGDLTIVKEFGVNNAYVPSSITVNVTGPSDYKEKVVLKEENNWTVTLEGLAFGEYTVTEDAEAADVKGYELFVTGESQNVTLDGKNDSVSVKITNTYSKVQVNPASVKVFKTDGNGEPLEGVTFTLYSDEALTDEVASKTTGEDGYAVFEGFNEAKTYYLKETKTLDYYNSIDTVWTVSVTLENGKANVAVDEEEGILKSVYNWIAGIDPDTSWKDGILTVVNEKKTGSLTISKEVKYYLDGKEIEGSLDGRENTDYTFKVEFSDETRNETFTLRHGEIKIIEGIPYGTEYTVTEETTGAVYVSTITDGKGIIEAEEAEVEVVNTYDYVTYNMGLNLVKVDDESGKPIKGAGFTLYVDKRLTQAVAAAISDADGKLILPITEEGTYYLKETTTPEGYYDNNSVYTITAKTEYKEVVGEEGNPVIQKQMIIRTTLSETVVNEVDYIYKVENKAIKKVTVSIEKIWDDGNYKNRPESIKVTLYKDGKAYETVTLNAKNKWSYEWKDLSEEFKWTVDETEVPKGYTKTVKQDGYKFTITNKYTKTPTTPTNTTTNTTTNPPKTGDHTEAGIWMLIALLTFAGMCAVLPGLRREEE